jgi:hypothetical protein
MSTLSTALKEAYARSKTSTRHLAAIEIILPATLEQPPLRFVNYDNDIEIPASSGIFYTGLAMDISEPESGAEPDDKVSVKLDGVPGTIQFFINSAIRTGSNIPVNMTPFAFNLQTETVIGDVIGTYNFLLLKAQYNDQAVVLELGHVSPTNQPFPGVKYSPANSAELYR